MFGVRTADGTGLVVRTNEAFGAVAESTGKVGELVAEIAAASKEQSQGIDQVNQAVSQMDKVTQQNAANAEESASASEMVMGIVNNLIQIVKGNVGSEVSSSLSKTVAKQGLNRSEQVFHNIADTSQRESATGVQTAAKSEIPFDDDFTDFNA